MSYYTGPGLEIELLKQAKLNNSDLCTCVVEATTEKAHQVNLILKQIHLAVKFN